MKNGLYPRCQEIFRLTEMEICIKQFFLTSGETYLHIRNVRDHCNWWEQFVFPRFKRSTYHQNADEFHLAGKWSHLRLFYDRMAMPTRLRTMRTSKIKLMYCNNYYFMLNVYVIVIPWVVRLYVEIIHEL